MSVLSALIELVVQAVKLLFRAIKVLVLESLSAASMLLVAVTLYRIGQLKFDVDAEDRRATAMMQALFVVWDVVALPLAVLLCFTWHSKDIRDEFAQWSLGSGDFEATVTATFCTFGWDALTLGLLVLPLLSWNHAAARQIAGNILAVKSSEKDGSWGLFARTLAEVLLFAVALPLVTFSWRAPAFYRSWRESDWPVQEFDAQLLKAGACAAVDLLLAPCFLVTICSWRSVRMMRDIREADTNTHMWKQICYHTTMVMLECMFVPLMFILTVCFWRARSGWKIALADHEWREKLQLIALEVLELLLDVPCIVVGILMCLTIYRAPAVFQIFVRQTNYTLEANSWRQKIVMQFLLFLLDLLILPLTLMVVATMVHLPMLFRQSDSNFNGWAEHEFAFAKFYGSYRANSLLAFGEILLDLLAVTCFCISLCCPWRTVMLMATVFLDSERLALAGLASALEDEKTRQLIEAHRMNMLLDDLSSGWLLHNQPLREATIQAMENAKSPFLQGRIRSRLESGIQLLRDMTITNQNTSYLFEAKRLCGVGDLHQGPGTNLMADLAQARMWSGEAIRSTWTDRTVHHSSCREQYTSLQTSRKLVLSKWLQFWATYDALLHPPALEFGIKHFSWRRARLLCFYYALNTLLDLSLIPAALVLAGTVYRLPYAASDFLLMKTIRSLRVVLIEHLYELGADFMNLFRWIAVLVCLTRAPELLTGTFEAVVARKSAVFWRGVTKNCWEATLNDLRSALVMLCSCTSVKYSLWVGAVTAVMPGVLAYQLVLTQAGGKHAATRMTKLLGMVAATIFNVAMIVVPAVFLYQAMPQAIDDLDSNDAHSKQAETAALGSMTAFFAILGSFVLVALWTFSRDATMTRVIVPYSADGQLVYMRKNWANLIAILSLVLDAVQLGTLVFGAGNINISTGMDSFLQDLGAGSFFSYFQWESAGVRNEAATKYGQDEVTMYLKFGLLALWVVTMTMPIVWDELSGEKQHGDERSTKLFDSSMFRAARSALGGGGFLTLVSFMLGFIACDFDTNPPSLRLDPSVECFRSEHLIFASLSFFGLAFYVPTALVFSVYNENSKSTASGADLEWSRLYELVTTNSKLAIAAALIFSGVTSDACLVVAVICACFVLFSILYQHVFGSPPCTAPEGTILRASAFALCFWTAVGGYHGLPSQDHPELALQLIVAGWAITALIALVLIAVIRLQRAAAMKQQDDETLVREAARDFQQLASKLPASAFTCSWHSGGQERWVKQAQNCKSFPHVVELADALVAQLREEIFATGVFDGELQVHGKQLRSPPAMDTYRHLLPGVGAWWPMRGKLVQSVHGLKRLANDVKHSMDPDLFTECEPPVACPTATTEAMTSTAQPWQPQWPSMSSSEAQGEEDGDRSADERQEEADAQEKTVSSTHDELKEIELTTVSAPPVPHVVLAVEQSPARLNAHVMRALLLALPPQLACLFDAAMVDLELLSVLQMWQDAPQHHANYVSQAVEYVPMSMVFPTQDASALHPALIYATPEVLEFLPTSSVQASMQYVSTLNNAEDAVPAPELNV